MKGEMIKIIIDYCLPDDKQEAISLMQRGLENIKNEDLAKEKISTIVTDEYDDKVGIEVSEAVHYIWIKKEDWIRIAKILEGENEKI